MTTRRDVLTGAAAAVAMVAAAPKAMGAEAEPIYAAMRAHGEACRAYQACFDVPERERDADWAGRACTL